VKQHSPPSAGSSVVSWRARSYHTASGPPQHFRVWCLAGRVSLVPASLPPSTHPAKSWRACHVPENAERDNAPREPGRSPGSDNGLCVNYTPPDFTGKTVRLLHCERGVYQVSGPHRLTPATGANQATATPGDSDTATRVLWWPHSRHDGSTRTVSRYTPYPDRWACDRLHQGQGEG
jgi:hypothetical protein